MEGRNLVIYMQLEKWNTTRIFKRVTEDCAMHTTAGTHNLVIWAGAYKSR